MENITSTFLIATPLQGLVFGLLSLPICLWVAYTDLSQMKIRNEAVLALFVTFVVSGIFLMPFTEYLWRYLHLAVILAVGFGLSTIRALGAGDAKFAAAMAPFVAAGDIAEVVILFAGLLVVTWVAHRLIRMIPPFAPRHPAGKAGPSPRIFRWASRWQQRN